jgi:hypothetical protein
LALKILVFLFYSFYLVSCQSQNEQLPFIEAITNEKLIEVKLGESDYYLKIPDGFEVTEARGKEGQLGYNIIPNDSISTMFGFVEIESGRPIGGGFSGKSSNKYVQSLFLNKKTTWKIYKEESGYFTAHTKKGDISSDVSSKSKNEIDSLISIIATLTRK